MMHAALAYLFPGIDFAVDVDIEDNGTGPRIARWNRQDPQPSAEEIEAAALPAARAAIWERIKAERDRRIQEQGYVAGGKRFHGDTFSRTQQMGLVMLGANIPPGLQWKTMDGSFITMTTTLAQQVFAAAAASDIALFGHAEALRAQVNAAEDPSSVDITAGWPA